MSDSVPSSLTDSWRAWRNIKSSSLNPRRTSTHGICHIIPFRRFLLIHKFSSGEPVFSFPIRPRVRIVYYWKTAGAPSHYKNVHVSKLYILKKHEKYVGLLYQTKLATICNSKGESGTCSGGVGNNAMDCSRGRFFVCITFASDRCNAIDNLWRNHVHNKLIEGLNRGRNF